jgi:ABC-2 type transport system permease protein
MVSRLETDRFKAILDMLPSDWRRFLSVDLEWLITYPGRISLAYQELIVILCMALWSIARGSDAVSGELNRGTLEMLLAQPLSRSRIFFSHASVTFVGVAVLAAAAFGGTCAGILTTTVKEEVSAKISLPFYLPGVGTQVPLPFGKTKTVYTPMSEKTEMSLFLPATVNLFALGFMIAGFSLLMSSWDRYRWRTIGITTGVLVVQVMLKLAGMASDSTHWLKYLSILSAYEPESFVRMADLSPASAWSFNLYDLQGRWSGFGPLASDSLLIGVGLICFLAGARILVRRDLPAPM